jgi:hypothetical protein
MAGAVATAFKLVSIGVSKWQTIVEWYTQDREK